MKSVK